MATKLNTIKTNIKTILQSLQTDQVLADVQVDDFKKSIFDRDFSAFPVAIMTTPTVESRAETNVHNMRVYTFEIFVLSNFDDVTDPAQIEDLIENILNKFDNDPTLKAGGLTGAADGAVDPSSSSPEAVTSGGRNFIGFSITIRARALRDLTFV